MFIGNVLVITFSRIGTRLLMEIVSNILYRNRYPNKIKIVKFTKYIKCTTTKKSAFLWDSMH